MQCQQYYSALHAYNLISTCKNYSIDIHMKDYRTTFRQEEEFPLAIHEFPPLCNLQS